MNFSGKFDPNPIAHSSGDSVSFVDLDSSPYRGASHAVTIPNAHLLFSGDFDRSGSDLIISDSDHRVVVPDYFHGEKRPTLMSPEGTPLDSKVIEALTGHVQYAQAAGIASAAKVVGHVVKMTGSASIVRNGVTVDLNTNDVVYQNDVVQTGSGSTLGLVLIDGTTFNMTANARLMLNDLVYDPASTSNSSLITLVQGAASFVAGQVAKTGDMKVATPVAILGIRGTAVNLDISTIDGKVSISVVDQQDNMVHAVQVYNNSGALIGTVTSNGTSLTLTPTATFEVIAQESNKTPDQIQQEFATFQQVLSTYDIGKQLFPNLPAHTELKQPDANPQSATKFAGTTIAPSDSSATKFNEPVGGNTSAQNSGGTATAVTATVAVASGTPLGGAKIAGSPITPDQALVVLVSPSPIPFVVTPSQVSQVSSGAGDHFGPVMSADGRYVTYDPDGAIFLYDRQTNATTTITPSGDGFSYTAPTISSDGHVIVYQGTKGAQSFVFLYDNDPVSPTYQQATQLQAGTSPAISGDGRTIAVEQDGSSIGIFDQHGLTLATITSAAAGTSGTVWKPAISADGHVIAFWTSNLAAAGGAGQLITVDRSTGHATAIANSAAGAGSSAASFSADGHYVAYQSAASDGHTEIYLYDLATGRVIFNTANASGGSYNPVISPDGHFIIFASDAKLTSDDTNSVADTYVVDVTDPSHPVYKLVSALPDGTVGNAASNLGAAISAGGLFVAFGSSASNLSNGGTGGSGQIFVVDPSSGHSALIQETSDLDSSPLTATGFIGLTGLKAGDTLPVVTSSDPRLSAVIESSSDPKTAATTYSIHWIFAGHPSDFSALEPGQVTSQNFVITLTTGVSTTAIPVKVSVYDAERPETPVLSAASAADHVKEDGTVALNITATPAEGDDDATTTVTISGLGTAALDNTAHDVPTIIGGSVTLTRAQLAGLSLHAPDDETASLTLSVTASTNENGSVAASAAQSILLTVTPVLEGPVLTGTAAATVSEGGLVTFGITDAKFDADDTLGTVTISGLPADLTGFSGSGTYDSAAGTWSGSAADFNALTFHAGESTGTFNLSISATNTTTGEATSTVESYTLTVTPVLEGPVLTGTAAATVSEGGLVTFGITDAKFDADDTLGTVTISGLPADLTGFSGSGTYDSAAGTWSGSAADFNALTFHAGESTGTFNLSISATNTTTGEATSTVESYTLTVTPVLEGPVLTGTAAATVSEGGLVTFGITDAKFDADDTLGTVTISGLPADLTGFSGSGTYDSAAGTWSGSAADFNALTFHAGESTGTFNLSISATNTTTGEATSTVESYTLTVTPVLEGPVLTGTAAATVSEGGLVTFGITDAKFDADDTLGTVTISGLPADLTGFSGSGTYDSAAGTWSGSAADFNALTFHAGESTGTFNLSISATNTTTGEATSTVESYTLTVTPVLEGPVLTGTAAATVSEGGLVTFGITDAKFDADDTLGTVTISGLPADLTGFSGSGTYDSAAGTWSGSAADFNALTFHAGESTGTFNLSISATNTTTGEATSTVESYTLTVTPVLEGPVLTGTAAATVSEGGLVTFGITDAKFDADDTLGTVTISGLPADLTGFSGSGTYDSAAGTWSGSAADFNALTFHAGESTGTFNLSISATNTTTGEATSTVESYTLTVTPVLEGPVLTGTAAATVSEGGLVTFGITDAKFDADDTLGTVTISGLPADLTGFSGSGTYDSAAGTWSGSAADFNALTFHAGESTGTFNLSISATNTTTGEATSTVESYTLTVTPVLEGPVLTGTAAATVSEGGLVTFGITDAKFDADDTLGTVTISGLPADLTGFSGSGTYDSAAGTWSGSAADFNALTFHAGESTGTFNLSISATNTTTGEATSTVESYTLTVTPVLEGPVLTGTAAATVSEGGLVTFGITDAKFDADDTLGTVTISGLPADLTGFSGSGTYDSAAGTWSGSAADFNALTFHAGESTGTFNLSISATNTTTGEATSTVESYTLTVTPVLEGPVLTGTAAATVSEGGLVTFGITDAKFDADDTLGTVTISGLPADLTGFSGSGTYDSAAGTWSGSAADFNALTFHAGESTGTFNLSISATNTTTGEATSTVESYTLTVTPVLEGPVLTGTAAATVSEGGLVTFGITDAKFDADDTLGTVTISGLPADLTGFSGSGTYDSAAGTWSGSAADFNALTFHAGESTGTFNLSISATNTTTGEATSTVESYTLTVTPVLEGPVLTGTAAATVSEGGLVTFGITDAKFDADDTLGTVTISGLPADLTGFSGSGTYDSAAGTWSGSAADFNALTFHAGESTGTFNLSISATNTTTGEATSTVESYTLTVTPVLEGPVLTGTAAATVSEGGLVTFGITDAKFDADDTLGTVTISGLPADLTGFSGSGTYDSAAGTWSGSAADFNALTFHAGESTGTFNLSISATNTTTGEATSTVESYTLTVTPVLEGPVLTGTAAATVSEGGLVTFGITDAKFDADDTLGTVTISGLPADLTGFSGSGTYDSAAGTWSGSAADFNALTFHAGESTGTFNLSISATNTTTGEATSTVESYTLTVTPVLEGPVLTGTAAATVSEGGLVTFGITDAKFDADDTLGTVTISGLPADLTGFSGSGTYDSAAGTWSGSAADFNALTFHAGESTGTFNLSISATNTTTGEATSTVESYTLTVTPVLEGPVLTGTAAATVSEGGLVTFGITDAKFDADDTLGTVTISGLPADLTGFSGSGTYDSAAGTWSGSAADFNALTFHAGESTGTFNLSISATNTTTGEATSTVESYTLTVTPVLEGPVLTGTAAATVSEGGLVTFGITDAKFDADDTLGTVTISGLPADLTGFSGSGTYDSAAGTWSGSAADFNALTFTAGKTSATLSISATNTMTGEATSTVESYTLTVNSVDVFWLNGVTGDWTSTPLDWSTGQPPDATNNVTIDAIGAYTVTISTGVSAHSLLLNEPGAIVDDTGSLSLGGQLTIQAGAFKLSGLIAGGTVSLAGGSFLSNSGTLAGVTYDGTLDLSASSSLIYVQDGFTGGAGGGTINLTGQYSFLYAAGTETLDNATLNIGNNSYDYIYDYDPSAAAVVTFGSHFTINHTGSNAILTGYNYRAGSGFINAGTINAGFNGGNFTIGGVSFTNQGSINVSNGDTVNISSTGWSNSGAINVSGGTLNLGGNFTIAQLGAINHTGGTVNVTGALDNSAATLNVGSGTALGKLTLGSNGTIKNGTIADAGSGLASFGGTLDEVTYQGTLDLSASSSLIYVQDGFTGGAGGGTINLTGQYSFLYAAGTETLDNATLNIGNNSYDYIYDYDPSAAAVVTFGSHFTINHTGSNAILTGYNYRAGSGFINAGSINAGFNGGNFTIGGVSFTNQGSINVSNGDTVNISSTDWSNSGAINVSGGTLNLGSNFTTAQLGAINHTGGTVNVTGALDNSAATLNVGSGTALGKLTLGSNGTIKNGTIADAGAGLASFGGTLDGVTYQGTLDLSASSSLIYVQDGFTGGAGGGTINLTGQYSVLYAAGTETLDNATLNIGNNSYDYIYDYDPSAAAVVTFGSHFTINHTGSNANFAGVYNRAGSGFINAGTINAGFNGGNFTIGGASFTNQGSINVSNGDTVNISSTGWSNSGAINVSGGTLNLGGNFTTAQLGAINHTGGTVNVTGALDNSAATLNVGSGTALGKLTLGSNGTIKNGTIADAGAGLASFGGTLDGVTYQGTLDLSASSSLIYVQDGFTGGAGGGTINLTGQYSVLYAAGTETLDNATLNIGNNSYDYIYDYDPSAAAVVTFGSHFTINHTGSNANFAGVYNRAGSGFINAGTINAGFNGGNFTIGGASFTNQGSINVSNGDTVNISSTGWSNSGAINVSGGTLNLGGNFTTAQLGAINHTGGTVNVTGALDNSAATLNVGSGTALGKLTLGSNGTIKNGTISDAGAGLASFGGTLDGVTYQGTLDLSASSSLIYVQDGFTGGAGGGTINLTGQYSFLYAAGTETLDNATLNIGNNSYDYIYDYDPSAAAVVTFGSHFTINHTGSNAILTGYNYRAGSGFINAGTINAGFNGGNFTIGGASFTNQGSINVSNGDNVTISSNTFTNVSSGILTSGIYVMSGGSTFTLPQNQTISDLAADVTISGSGSAFRSFQASGSHYTGLDTTLTSITSTGAFRLLGGAGATEAQAVSDSGILQLGGGDFATSALTVSGSGSVFGFGTLSAPIMNAGLVEAQGGRMRITGTVSGTGAEKIDAAATLELDGAISSGQTITFAASTGNLVIAEPASFAGTIAGFAIGDQINLISTNATAVSYQSNILSVRNGASTVATLYLAGNYSSSTDFQIGSDGNGGSVITIGPPPVITGNFWKSSNSGDWGFGANWNPSGIPNGTSTAAVIAASGTYTVTIASNESFAIGTVTVGGQSATLNIAGSLNVSNALIVNSGAVAVSGTISGGTIQTNGGSFVGTGGTLDAITLQGTLDLSASNASIFIKGGLAGGGTINLTGQYSVLYAAGTETLDNATLNIGNNSYDYIYDYDPSAAAVVTFGSHFTINHTGSNAILTGYNYRAGSGFINAGSINAGFNGGNFTIGGASFTNQGSINVSNGDTVNISSTGWSNSGAINVSGGTLNLGGNFTTAQLGAINHTGGTVNVTGALDNSAATLNVGSGTALGKLTLGSNGTIKNGTISDAGAGLASFGGTLDGVTYQGTLDLSASSSLIYVQDGFTGGAGGGTINLTGQYSFLYAAGTETLDNATLNIGNNSYDYIYDYDPSAAAVVTFGSHFTINHTGSNAILTGYNYRAGSGFINAGSINAGFNGGNFTIGGVSFTNQGSINVSNGDTVNISSTDWSNSGAINVSGGTLNLGSNFTTAQLGAINHTGGTVNVTGALDNSAATLNVGSGTALGKLTLGSNGTIKNGTIADAGAGLASFGGTLDGVTYQGTLDLSASSSLIYVQDGFTGGAGGGTINLTGQYSVLYAAGTETLDNATLNIGNNSYDYIYDYDPIAAAVVTFGSHFTINHTGSNANFAGVYNRAGSGFINAGTINAGFNGGNFTIGGASFTNQGSINVSNGDTVNISSTDWSNSGAINVSGGTLNLGSNFTTAQLGAINHTGGTVNVTGALDNSAATLNVGSGTALGKLTLGSNGTIKNGTIADAGAGLASFGGTLDGVTYQGTLDLSASSSLIYVQDGFTGGAGGGTINLTGQYSVLYAAGTETLDNATLNIGNNSYDYIYDYDPSAAAVVTFGSHFTINHTGSNANFAGVYNRAGSGFINAGTINAGFNGGNFTIGGVSFTNQGSINVSNGDTVNISSTGWSNSGAINVSGGTLNLGGNFTTAQLGAINHTGGTVNVTGALDNSAATLNVGSGTALGKLTLGSNGTIKNGTISDAGAGLASFGGTLDGVTYQGTLDLSASSSLIYVQDGFTGGAGGGTINLTGQYSVLYAAGTETLDNATLNIGNNSYDYIYDYDPSAAAVVTFGSHFTINHTGSNANFAGVYNRAGSGFINAGTINAGFNGGNFTIGGVSFTNQGSINVSNGDTVNISSTDWSNSGAINVSGGTLNLGSNFTTAQLGAINHTGGTVNVTGALDNSAATLNVGSGTALGKLTLGSNGTIKNGTISDAGAGLASFGGTLDGVTYQGTLDLSASSSLIYVQDGFTGGAGGGTINLTGQYSFLYAAGTETLDNATLNIGNNSYDYIYDYDPSAAAVVTFGSHFTINHTGSNAIFAGVYNRAGSGFINAGTINAGFNGGNFTIGGASFTNQGSINVSNGDTVNITAGTFLNSGALIANGGNIAISTAETIGGTATIHGTSDIGYSAESYDNVTFAAGSTGELLLFNSGSFHGTVTGFTGSGTGAPDTSDKFDLRDINFNSPNFSNSYFNNVLTVTDGSHTANIEMVGSYTIKNFHFASDGSGGTLVTDPPAPNATPDFVFDGHGGALIINSPAPISAAPAVLASVASDGVGGSITFTGANSAGMEIASVTPEASNYLGKFSLGSITEKGGAASIEFSFNDDHVNLAPGQTLTQSYNVAVADPHNPAGAMNQTVSFSIGGPGNDNFVFKPGIGADTIVNFNAQQDAVELYDFSSAQTIKQLQALITTDVHGDAVIELGHGDSITLVGTTAQQLEAIVQSAVHLH